MRKDIPNRETFRMVLSLPRKDKWHTSTPHFLTCNELQPLVEVMPSAWLFLCIDEAKQIKSIHPQTGLNTELTHHVALCLPSARHLTHFCCIPTSGAVCFPSSHMPSLFIPDMSHSQLQQPLLKASEAAAYTDFNRNLISLSDLTWRRLNRS